MNIAQLRLAKAIEENNLKAINEFTSEQLRTMVPVRQSNHTDDDLCALNFACSQPGIKIETMALIINKLGPVNAQFEVARTNNKKQTLLHVTCGGSHSIDIIILLLNTLGHAAATQIFVPDNNRCTAFDCVLNSTRSDEEKLKLLQVLSSYLDKGAEKRIARLRSAYEDRAKIIDLLMQTCAKPKTPPIVQDEQAPKTWQDFLKLAIEQDDVASIAGFNWLQLTSALDTSNLNALGYACFKQKFMAIRAIIERLDNLGSTYACNEILSRNHNSMTPLHYIFWYGGYDVAGSEQIAILSLFLSKIGDKLADVMTSRGGLYKFPLQLIFILGEIDAVRLTINALGKNAAKVLTEDYCGLLSNVCTKDMIYALLGALPSELLHSYDFKENFQRALSNAYLDYDIKKLLQTMPPKSKLTLIPAPAVMPGPVIVEPLKVETPPPLPEKVVPTLGLRVINLNIPYCQLTFGKKLGKGGFGEVFEGQWLGCAVAIKQLIGDQYSSEALTELKDEAKVMASFNSPYIVQLMGMCVEPAHYCLVMELMPKGNLYELLKSGQPLAWASRYQIAQDIALGLRTLHTESIVHRDLKSMNVLLDGNDRAKLADFGLATAKMETTTQMATTMTAHAGHGEGVGTLLWMAPELFRFEPKYGRASDIYALAIVLWEIAARKLPYEACKPAMLMTLIERGQREKIPKDTPPTYAALIAKCWAQRRKDRPSIDDVLTTLEECKQSLLLKP